MTPRRFTRAIGIGVMLATLISLAPGSPLRSPASALASAYSSAVLGDSPVSYWGLDELSGTTASDSAGTNNGTYTNTQGLGAPGAIAGDPGAAYNLDPGSGYVSLNQSASLMPTSGVSVEAWIKPSQSEQDYAAIFHSPQTSGAGGYGLDFLSGRARMYVYSTSSTVSFAEAITAAPNGTWSHVIGTWDGSTVRLYFNGALQAATPVGAIYYGAANQNAQIGRSSANTTTYGTVDDVSVYPTALTAAKIANHYQLGSGNVPPGAPTSVTATGGANQATVSWTAPTSTGSGPITGYTVTPHLGTTARTPITFTSTNTSQTLTNLSAGTYTFTVVAINTAGAGTASSPTAAVTVTGATYAYSSTILADSPKGYWRLGEAGGSAFSDASANGTDGIWQDTVTYGRPGGIANDPNTSVAFGGTSTVGRVANSTSLAITGALSLEAWVRFSSTPTTTQDIIEKGDGTGTIANIAYRLGYDPSAGFFLSTCIGNTCTTAAGGINPTLYKWIYVVGTRTAGGALTLYINGAQAATASDGGGSLNQVSAAVGIGGPGLPGAGQTYHYLSGGLSEPAVYAAALTPAQITAHWQAAGYVPGAPTGVTATAGTYQATVSWTPPAYAGTTPITNYQVIPYIGTKAYAPVSALTATSVTVNSLTAGASYTFVVVAINDSGSSPNSSPSAAVTIAGNTPYANAILSDSPSGYWRLGESRPLRLSAGVPKKCSASSSRRSASRATSPTAASA